MTRQTDHRRPSPRRLAVVGPVLVVAVTLLTGCGAASEATDVMRVPTPATAPDSPSAPSGAEVPPVPVQSSALDDVAAPVVVAPVALAVPALRIELTVDPVGVEADGQMEIPPVVERAGWYRFGPTPGADAGTAVIAAHVDSEASAGLGPFARLQDASVGDLVEVVLADGSTRQFAVTGVERRPKSEIPWPDVFVRDGPPRLVLVTCGGAFQRDTGRYTDNVLVTAEPVGS